MSGTIRRLLLAGSVLFLLAGCTGVATRGMADNLSSAILNQRDPETVQDGAPAFLLLVDSFIAGTPGDPALLTAGSNLYGAYAAAFVQEPDRVERLTAQALHYAEAALCEAIEGLCPSAADSFRKFAAELQRVDDTDEAPVLFTYGAALAGYIQARRDDWAVVAELPRVRAVMERVAALDESHNHGRAHLYLGVVKSQLPSALGGTPEQGRAHFEKAIALSGGRDLVAYVEFAESYARLIFNRELHDTLLRTVLAADPLEPGLTLSNVLAQRRAALLLAAADNFFGD